MNSDLLVRRAAGGDSQAFAELIGAERTRMLRVAGYYVRDRNDAEDVVQEAICRALVALPSLKEPAYFRTWLTRIVINASLSLLQRNRRTIPSGGIEEERLDPASADHDRRLDLLQALADLPSRYRRIVILRYLHDLKQTEVAELLELPLGTVKTLQSKALKLLREHYRDEMAERGLDRSTARGDSDESDKRRLGDMYGKHEAPAEQEIAEKLRQLRSQAQTFMRRETALEEARLQPFIEEVFRQGDEIKELLFVWNKPGTEFGLSVTLNVEGELTDYAVDPGLYGEASDRPRLNEQELLQIGERFVRDHYPDAPDLFGRPEAEDRGDRIFFTAYQYASGMPLPRSGYQIDLHRSGFVSAFKYFGSRPQPVLPEDRLTPQEALDRIASGLEMKLYVNMLHESVYAEGDDRLHLLYVPEPFLTGIPALRSGEADPRPNEVDDPKFDPCAGENGPIADFMQRFRQQKGACSPTSPLEWIGVREEDFELLREADMGGERTIVYRRRSAASNRDLQVPYTLDGYMQTLNEDTIKVRIDRESGRLSGLMDLREERGGLSLDDNACLQIALRFLHAADPGILPYLRLDEREADEDDSVDEPLHPDDNAKTAESVAAFRRRNPVFRFSVCKNGVPGFWHHVSIGVNRSTGFVVHYMGADLDAEELRQLSVVPALTPEEAKLRLLQALDLRLCWELHYGEHSSQRTYLPYYKPFGPDEDRKIRMVEAHTGTIISEKT
ncbi:hypothetical protein CDO73_17020 [Saccharibacillus sp. O23]|uniref:sigma-70 family RNA polymerase sigma factor n=1 Tax=Saccharibacillus sp. O23 TaxID=2009338 RepID=UPI000B4E642A|nr:sigma-70 family RNA polymerase sigma factor [Saccharibacillus sp. O23]OWR28911.1 hypothetical protein CDO73_17020 [Saccharibacillus sp. O23]